LTSQLLTLKFFVAEYVIPWWWTAMQLDVASDAGNRAIRQAAERPTAVGSAAAGR
jgi:hypothetical protein